MQPCEVCESTGVDGDGYCERCHVYRGTPPQVDDAWAGETMRVYAPSSGGGYYPAQQSGYGGPQPTSPPYPTVSSGPPYPEPVRHDPPAPPTEPARPQPVRQTSSMAPLFMVTVMVVVIVAGVVSVIYILAGDRGGVPRADVAPPPASGAPASTAPAQCLVGTWTLTRWNFNYGDEGQFTTEAGRGTYSFRADGTGEWDFGSGIAASGTYAGKQSTARLTGRLTFEFTIAGATISYHNMVANTGIVVYQSGRVVADAEVEPDTEAESFSCTGDKLQFTSEGSDVELRRR
jgi:hypothetical protein